jgi:hypothetical protein
MPTEHKEGFNPTLFKCIDKAATSILGRESISTFYYAIQESYHIPEEDFPKRPQDVLKSLHNFLGDAGFAIIKNAVTIEVRTTFKIQGENLDLDAVIELAKRSYLLEDINPGARV